MRKCCVGIWAEAGITYLDISVSLASLAEAISLGTEYNQVAIYDLSRGRVIETGGTGESVADLVPEAERLPPLVRGLGEDIS